ncbi:MAG TPA: antibiotic biosynthesis monooxygenase [Longimicrobiales bacterium]|nr:antibiotic biosynthesis monooxygenase [Longimicrobiales bacterium]
MAERVLMTLPYGAGSGRGAAVVRDLAGLVVSAVRWAARRWGANWGMYAASVGGDPRFPWVARGRASAGGDAGRAVEADEGGEGGEAVGGGPRAPVSPVSARPIARLWRGATRARDADRYLEYLAETGVRESRAVPGNLGVRVLRRIDGDRAEFLFVSLWDSMDAVRSFAGDDPERAVFYPEDDGFLVEREEEVRHYEVALTRSREGSR